MLFLKYHDLENRSWLTNYPNHCQLRFPQATKKKESKKKSHARWLAQLAGPLHLPLDCWLPGSHQDPFTARPLRCLQDLLHCCWRLESKRGQDPLLALDSSWPRTHTDPSGEGGCKGWRAGLPEGAWLHRVENRGSLLFGIGTRQGGCGTCCLGAGEMGIGWGCGKF